MVTAIHQAPTGWLLVLSVKALNLYQCLYSCWSLYPYNRHSLVQIWGFTSLKKIKNVRLCDRSFQQCCFVSISYFREHDDIRSNKNLWPKNNFNAFVSLS